LGLASVVAGGADGAVVISLGSLAAALETGALRDNIVMPIFGSVGLVRLVLFAWAATIVGLGIRAVVQWRATALAVVPMEMARSRLVESFFSATHLEQRASRIGELNDLLVTHSPRVGLVLANVAAAISSLLVMVVVAATAFFVDPLTFLIMLAAVASVSTLAT